MTTEKKPIPQPLHDRVIISDPPKPEQASVDTIAGIPVSGKMQGGILIPDSVSDATMAGIMNPHFEATVLAAGPDCKAVKVGDRIVTMRKDIFPMKIGEENWTLVREGNICAII